jgi:hypothetical protein
MEVRNQNFRFQLLLIFVFILQGISMPTGGQQRKSAIHSIHFNFFLYLSLDLTLLQKLLLPCNIIRINVVIRLQ